MIYKKIENFFAPLMDNRKFPLVFGILVVLLTAPLWFPFWVVSKFWNTPNA